MLRSRRLLWQIYLPFLLVTVASLLAVAWYTTTTLRLFYREQTQEDLFIRARMVLDQVRSSLIEHGEASIQGVVEPLGESSAARITVILPDGTVIGDSAENPLRMSNHADRPEVREALEGHVGQSDRYSATVRMDMLYFALPLEIDGKIVGVVRTAMPLTRISQGMSYIYARVSITGVVVALVAAFMSLVISRRITHPLEEMKRGAERFARGEFGKQLPVADSEEIGALAEAMNQMAVQLEDRISTIDRQRNELEAVFSSMVEGVLAVDQEERIIGINQAAARLFKIDDLDAMGKKIREVIPNQDMTQVVASALSSQKPVEADVILKGPPPRYLQAHGTVLRDSRGVTIGVLVVLEDITRMRNLEDIRRDFVANVSHELRTPITSIKGFVETLLDGAMHDPEDTRHFLDIIAKQSDRLNAIITDLLSLSRIERDEEQEAILLEETNLRDILDLALQTCSSSASAKFISIELDCPSPIPVRANPQLIEQAVVNLVDNAVKYSDPHKPISVQVQTTESYVVIHVRDSGAGIEAEHLPRLFERFYRVDKARSRRLGGTGLGLAIVKHIAQAHRGWVHVQSKVGEGSRFSIYLPLRQEIQRDHSPGPLEHDSQRVSA